MLDICPHCNANLQGSPIPQASIDAGYYGDDTHFSNVIGIEIRGVYDGVLFWGCPRCGGRWHRWEEGTRQHTAAQPYIDGSKEI